MGNTNSQESFFRSVQGFISKGLKYLFFSVRSAEGGWDGWLSPALSSGNRFGWVSFVRRTRVPIDTKEAKQKQGQALAWSGHSILYTHMQKEEFHVKKEVVYVPERSCSSSPRLPDCSLCCTTRHNRSIVKKPVVDVGWNCRLRTGGKNDANVLSTRERHPSRFPHPMDIVRTKQAKIDWKNKHVYTDEKTISHDLKKMKIVT